MKDKIRKDAHGRFLDNPDGVRTTKESLFDMHEDMQTVDAISVEDLNIQAGAPGVGRGTSRQAYFRSDRWREWAVTVISASRLGEESPGPAPSPLSPS
jgi:hypothetical protein